MKKETKLQTTTISSQKCDCELPRKKEKSLQQEINEYQIQEQEKYIKYIVDFYKLHMTKDNETIKQLYKEEMNLIISDEGLQDIKASISENF